MSYLNDSKQRTCLQEAMHEMSKGTSFDMVKQMINSTDLPEKIKEQIKGEVALRTL